MKIIIIIEQNTQNLYEYTVRTRVDAFSVSHVKMSDGFTTPEDAQEYAEVIAKGAGVAGAETKVVASYEIADELPDLPVYDKNFRSFKFEVVWEKL
jgi:cation transport regulator ChaC